MGRVQDEPAEPPRPPTDGRIEEIFGTGLGTEDTEQRGDQLAREDWYRENRPPHHDGS